MKIENPAALRFIIDDDIYLLNKDKNTATILAPPPATKTPAVEFKYVGGNKKNFLIMVHYVDQEFIDDAHLTALENILKRKELYIDDVAILNMAAHAGITIEQVTGYFKPEKLLLMGENALPQNMNAPTLNQQKNIDSCRFLYSFSFDGMMSSTENKRVFWEQMKLL